MPFYVVHKLNLIICGKKNCIPSTFSWQIPIQVRITNVAIEWKLSLHLLRPRARESKTLVCIRQNACFETFSNANIKLMISPLKQKWMKIEQPKQATHFPGFYMWKFLVKTKPHQTCWSVIREAEKSCVLKHKTRFEKGNFRVCTWWIWFGNADVNQIWISQTLWFNWMNFVWADRRYHW